VTVAGAVTALSLLAMAGLLIAAAGFDVASRSIPNWICGCVALLALVARSADGLLGVIYSLVAASCLFAVLLVVYMRGALGGGDVKLATAVAVGLPPGDTYDFVVATAFAGGVLALLYLLLRMLPAMRPLPAGRGRFVRIYGVERWRIRRRGPLPYGVAIAAGGVFTLLHVIGR
jgi:prepilin peptidase CpaA